MILSQLAGVRIFGTGGLGKPAQNPTQFKLLTAPEVVFIEVAKTLWIYLV